MGTTANPLLSQVMRIVRSSAPIAPNGQRFSVRMDCAGPGVFAQVWFLTRGCTWDRAGACTMCNYGHGPAVSSEAMVESVERALDTIQGPVDELLISPSGSMLDPGEVPPGARLEIYKRVAAFKASRICVETRAETVTPHAVEELAASLAAKDVAVEVGLESSSPWIQRFCINKMSDPRVFPSAARLLKKRGLRVYANLSLGSAFLAPAEAIEDAHRSIRWSLEHGADLALVFPMHVKRHTLLAWLHERGFYRPPSLWSLVEVLSRLELELISRVSISWYRTNYESVERPVVSPTTCPRCQARVLALLDRFRDAPSSSTLSALRSEECECRQRWRQEVSTSPEQALPERVLRQYELIAHDFGLTEWWTDHGGRIRGQLERVSVWP